MPISPPTPASTVDDLPEAPNRATMPQTTYSSIADAWAASLNAYTTQINAASASINANATASQNNATLTAADAVATAADRATVAADKATVAADKAIVQNLAAGLSFTSTSTSNVTIGTGTKTFTVQAGESYQAGMPIVAVVAGDTDRYVAGIVTSYSGTTLEIAVPVGGTKGSGSSSSWNISIGGMVGPQGPAFTGGPLTTAMDYARATVASHATTAAIWAAAGNEIDFTGTATITDFPDATQAGSERILHCAGACTFTHNANIFVPGAANYTATAGDIVRVHAITTSTFRLEIEKVSPNMVGDSGAGGKAGLVPAPAAGDAAAGKFLRADGTWGTAGFTAGDLLVTADTTKTTPQWLSANTVYTKATYPTMAALMAGFNLTIGSIASRTPSSPGSNLTRTFNFYYGLGLYWRVGDYFVDNGDGTYTTILYVSTSPDLETWTNRLSVSTTAALYKFASNLAFSATEAAIAFNGSVYASTGGAFNGGTAVAGAALPAPPQGGIVAGTDQMALVNCLTYANSTWVLASGATVYYSTTGTTGSWSSSASGITNAALVFPMWTGSTWVFMDTYYGNRKMVKWNGASTWTNTGAALNVGGNPTNGFQVTTVYNDGTRIWIAYYSNVPSGTNGFFYATTTDEGGVWNGETTIGSATTTKAVLFLGSTYNNLVFVLDGSSNQVSVLRTANSDGTLTTGSTIATTSWSTLRSQAILVKGGAIRGAAPGSSTEYYLSFNYDPETQFITPAAPTIPTGTVARYRAS